MMESNDDMPSNSVIRAAMKALETGNASHILMWIPKESANTMKNLLERACCERTIRKDTFEQTATWYFETVNRLHSTYSGSDNSTYTD